MKPLASHEIRGNWATLLSTWSDDESLHVPRMESQIDALIAAGVNGIYSHGTAGEFHTQTEAEFDQISHLLASKCEAASMPFQIGVSHMSAQISLDRLRRVVSLRPSAVQVILPDWFPVTEEESYRFLARMAEVAGDIGLVLYNPPHAKVVLSPCQLAQLAERVPALVGIKVAGGPNHWYAQMERLFDQLSVFIPGHVLASGVAQGAHGAYSNVACLSPKVAQWWYELTQTNLHAALEFEQRIVRFMDEQIVPFITRDKYCNAACDRLLAQIGNWTEVGSRMRWPYRSIPSSEAERLRPLLHELLPEFSGECRREIARE